MPKINKQFHLEVTVEQFLNACSLIELQELDLLLDTHLKRAQHRARVEAYKNGQLFIEDSDEDVNTSEHLHCPNCESPFLGKETDGTIRCSKCMMGFRVSKEIPEETKIKCHCYTHDMKAECWANCDLGE
ncbi:hypothetical protein [Mongoliitalea lutea]|uniref:Uncharacterized protein n=1 Tax=Mongoliitalea lutea TaxID=849756 RepID=A0A8J3CZ28_9BACT|nr:hypothetical protein [Mongoliitalea lutea]GHB44562.1 hypothetical protein GCM10008106_27050 [Mongoliitalea lutea]